MCSFYQQIKTGSKMKDKKSKTLLVDDIKELKALLMDFDGQIEAIEIAPELGQKDVKSLVESLDGLQLFEVVSKPDPNLEPLGVEMDYFAIDPINVTDVNLTDKEYIIFNGKVKIPRKPSENVNVVGTFFTDEQLADELCQEFNIHVTERVEELSKVLVKSLSFRKKIADNAMS